MRMMKIKSHNELKEVISKEMAEYDDFSIELNNDHGSLFISSSLLTEDKVVISLSAADKSIGVVADSDDHQSKMNFIQENCLNLITGFPITITLIEKINIDLIDPDDAYDDDEDFEDDGYYEIGDYRDEYFAIYEGMKELQPPICINNANDALKIFSEFLKRKDFDKLIISFSILIPDLNHTYLADLVVDKLYVYGRTLISFVLARPDMKEVMHIEFNDNNDIISEFVQSDKNSVDYVTQLFYSRIMTLYAKTSFLSNEKVKICARSNCKLLD